MSKYAPLGEFLATQNKDDILFNFKDIEKILGFRLPKSAYEHRAWWSNNPTNNVMTAVWVDAGFETASVDMKKHSVVFCRTVRPKSPTEAFGNGQVSHHQIGMSDVARSFTHQHGSGRHPLRGALKGTLRIAAGTDLTKPADPDWADRS